MTRVIIDNSNTTVATPRYIEFWTPKLIESFDNESISFNIPKAPSDWISGGVPTAIEKIIFDLKQSTEGYQFNGTIDVDSNRNSGPGYTANPVSYVEVAKDYLKEIAKSGGVINLTVIRSSGSTTELALITNLTFTENSHEHSGDESPREFEVSISLMLGENSE